MWIKISPRTNQWVKVSAIIQLVLLLTSIVINVASLTSAPTIFYTLTAGVAIINLLLYTYMISVLIYFAEKRAIVVAYIIYLLLDIVRNVYGLILLRLVGFQFGPILGIVILLVTIYLFIVSMLVKCVYISFPFKLFAFSIFALTLLKILATFIFPWIVDSFSMGYQYLTLLRTVIDFLGFLWLILPISAILIARGANDYINSQNSDSANSCDEMEESY